MKLVALALTLAAGALPFSAQAHDRHVHYEGDRTYVDDSYVITVSCFRGPLHEVIWDHPNAVFVDSLVHVGYDFPNAHAIAERICRDSAGVGNPEYLKEQMHKVLHEAPLYRQTR